MKYRLCLLFLLFMLFCVSAGFADTESGNGSFWLCPGVETALYSYSGASLGGGFALGYGKGSSVGVKAVWFFESNGINILELDFLLRFFFFGRYAYSGPFLQFMGGPSLFFVSDSGISIPSEIGSFSIGMGFGWRFLIKEKWFIEPSVRAGYPYLTGAGLSAGICF